MLQPELAAIDVHQDGVRTTVLAHGGALLHARVVNESSAAITYAFDGVGTTLAGARQAGAGGVESIVLANGGTVNDPIALLTVKLAPGSVPEPPQNVDGRDVLLAFDAASQGAPRPSNLPIKVCRRTRSPEVDRRKTLRRLHPVRRKRW